MYTVLSLPLSTVNHAACAGIRSSLLPCLVRECRP